MKQKVKKVYKKILMISYRGGKKFNFENVITQGTQPPLTKTMFGYKSTFVVLQ